MAGVLLNCLQWKAWIQPSKWPHQCIPALALFLGIVPNGHGFLFFSREADWMTVPHEALAMDEPKLSPEAGVEALLIQIELDDSDPRETKFHHYLRLKVFDEKGLRSLDKIEILDSALNEVSGVAARVIHQDGSIIKLDKSEVYEREAIRYGDFRGRVKSFSFPGLEVGSVVEYQWKSSYRGGIFNSIYPLSLKYPAHQIQVRVKPYRGFPSKVFWTNFDQASGSQEERDGFKVMDLYDYLPFPDVEFPPPKLNKIPWFGIIYGSPKRKYKTNEDVWRMLSSILYTSQKDSVNSRNRRIRKATDACVQGVDNEMDKLQRIYTFVQTEISNLSVESSGYSRSEVRDLKASKTVTDVLGKGYGQPAGIRHLFASMAEAAGFEVCLARCVDRNRIFFSETYTHPQMLSKELIAVQTADGWQFFDPGNRFLPFGKLEWEHTSVYALLAHKDRAFFQKTPGDDLGRSKVTRTADLELKRSGLVTGTVTIRLTGSDALQARHDLDSSSPDELKNAVVKMLHPSLDPEQIANVRVENLYHLESALVVEFDINFPGFADASASRLFINPALFVRDADAMFEEEQRALDIYFRYPATYTDTVSISLPKGYILESPDMPASIGDVGFANHSIKIGMLPSGRLGYQRMVDLSLPMIPVKYYSFVRQFFRTLQVIDQHVITLHEEEPAS